MSINITMVGVRGSGKTCYLYATYNEMMDGFEGFKFIPTDHFKMLELEDKWDYMVNNCEFPPGTQESSDYEFNCMHRGVSLGTFNWYDYKGGILTESNGQLYNDLNKRIVDSDCIIVALPADMLLALMGKESAYEKPSKAIRTYQQLVFQVKATQPHLPIVFNITKGDLMKGADYRGMVDLIKDRFDMLFTDNSGPTIIVRTSIGKVSPDGGVTIAPRCVHIPILLGIYIDLVRQRNAAKRGGGYTPASNTMSDIIRVLKASFIDKATLFIKGQEQDWREDN